MDGSDFFVEISIAAMMLDGKPALFTTWRDITDRKRAEEILRNHRDLLALQKEELETTLARVKQLEGIIPICSYCNKIRDDTQSWHQLETYISNHSEAMFSHGACPDCLAEQMKIIKIMK